MEPVNREFISPHLETQSPDPSFGTDNSPYQPRKRPRPAQSCLSCRKKKLKCDRLAPCRQCIMRAAQCAYDHEEAIRSPAQATEESSLESDERRRKVPIPPLPREVRNPAGVPVVAPFTPIARSHESTRVIQDLQDRVRRLEQLISDQSHGSIEAPRQSSLCVSQTPGSSTNLGTLNVKGSRSRFYGQNQKSTLLREVSPMLPPHFVVALLSHGLC